MDELKLMEPHCEIQPPRKPWRGLVVGTLIAAALVYLLRASCFHS